MIKFGKLLCLRHDQKEFLIMTYLSFFKAFLNDFQTVGSVWPSSDYLVKEMTTSIAQSQEEKKHILEVGAGTGVITKDILSQLKQGDTLDIVEIHPEFAKNLRILVNESGKAHQVKIHEVGIEKFQTNKKYTHIVSSLPLTNFDTPLVIEIYRQFKKLLNTNGILTYFEYQGLNARIAYCKLFRQINHFKRLNGIKRVKENFLKKRHFKVRPIFSNLPPARVFHVHTSRV